MSVPVVTKVRYRGGTSFARGRSIDPFLSDDLCKLLYEKWLPGWPRPLEYPGTVYVITIDMLREVPRGELYRTYGPKQAPKIEEALEKASI